MPGILGVHVAKISKVLDPPNKIRKSMYDAIIKDCEILGLNAAQIFTHGPRGYKRNIMDYKKLNKLSKNIHLSVHSSYPSVSIWKLKRKNLEEKNSKRILSHILDQLKISKEIGSQGLVVHISRQTVEDIHETMKAIEPFVKKIGIPIWLEMISSKAHPDLTYESPKKINKLVNKLSDINSKIWGICIDTAHVYGSGLDISSKKQQDAWFSKLSKKSINKIRLFHLNGTESELGSGKDKHAIGFSPDDNIYKKFKKNPEKSGIYSIIKFCKSNSIPVILEINKGAENDTIELINIITNMEKI